MEKQTPAGRTEYPVSPEAIASALSAKVQFSTGILTPNTICIMSEGAKRIVVEYRPPQRTGLWLEGSDNPVHAPLPGLLMIRQTTTNQSPSYHIFAVADRPASFGACQLFHPPLPNVSNNGSVCWGSVPKVSAKALTQNDLTEDWGQLLGTPFGSHSVDRKCRSYPNDIRRLYLALEKRKARVYPKRELIPAKGTLRDLFTNSNHDGEEFDDDI